MRKSIWPMREVVNILERVTSPLISPSIEAFLRDLYDHTIQIIDNIESYRDTVSSIMDIYLSSISNKLNSIMKVLTIIATIFIPLTFITGLYGMNFKYMPELNYKYGYPIILLIIIFVVVYMIIYFKRKKWL